MVWHPSFEQHSRVLSQRSLEIGGPSGCRATPLVPIGSMVQPSNRRRLYHESCSHVLVDLLVVR